MIHDPALTDLLAKFEEVEYKGSLYRATRKSLDPLAPSSNGGRWMKKNHGSVLYTSTSYEGALAELSFHWSRWTPMPSKPAVVSKLSVEMSSTLRLLQVELNQLGVEDEDLALVPYDRLQEIGAAANFLEFHGILVPSARWDSNNLVIFSDNAPDHEAPTVLESNEVDWLQWYKENVGEPDL